MFVISAVPVIQAFLTCTYYKFAYYCYYCWNCYSLQAVASFIYMA